MRLRTLSIAAAGILLVESAYAWDGTIQFNGSLTENTCAVSGAVSGTTTVNMPALSSSALQSIGATGGEKKFDITVSGCTGTVANNVATYFEGAIGKPNAANGRLPSSHPDVDVQLLDGTGTNILDLTQVTTAASFSGTGAARSATQSFTVRYYARVAKPGAGTVNASVTYSLVYN